MRIFLAVLVGIFVCASTSQSQPLSPKLQSAMEAAAPGEKIAVIIELADRVNPHSLAVPGRSVRQLSSDERREHRAGVIRALKEHTDRSQGGLRDFLRGRGVEKQQHLWINNSIAAAVTPETLQELAARPEVASVRLDGVVQMPIVVPAATGGVEDNLIQVNADALWALGYQGEGTVVALIDSGVDYLHADLNSKWRGGSNSWFNPVADSCTGTCTSCDLSATLPCDFLDFSNVAHGTGVAGVMVGGNAGSTSIGVAPRAQWIAAKIFKSDGNALLSDIHLAYQWVLDPDGNAGTDDAPDVVNSSWGLDPAGSYFDEFRPDVQALIATGIAAIFSAGNFGPNSGTDVSPGNYPESLAVGSVGTALNPSQVSDFSSRGPSHFDNATIYPDLAAPGYFIRTTDFTFGGALSNYIFLTGTSFSAPHVSGILALLTQAFPQTPLADLEDAIVQSAQDLGALGPDNDYGYGQVDALAAYDWLVQAPNIAISDPVPPTNDRQLDFGTLLLSEVSQQTITCSNSGRGELQIGTLSLGGDPTFSLAADNCSGQVLTAGQSCALQVAFSSTTAGAFSGTLTIPSNDFDEPAATVALQGIASEIANPPPRLVISDSVAPTGDRNIPFGMIEVGSSRTESFQVTNDDLGDLILDVLDISALDSAFTVVTDGCSGLTLAYTESCAVTISFEPGAKGTFSSQVGLSSNDPDTPLSQITLSGTGNSLPPAPVLLSPADGASNVSVPVDFTWRQRPDPDGEDVVDNLYFSTDPDFTGATPIQITALLAGQGVLTAGFCGLLLTGLLIRNRRRAMVLQLLVLLAAVTLLVSCHGGGSSTDSNLRSYSLSGLSSQTTYYWKVVADDGSGGKVESSVASFTTQ